MPKRSLITLDEVTKEPIIRPMKDSEKKHYYFGESVGLLVFRPWYACIPYEGHVAYAKTYDFPVRIKFVDEPFDPAGFHESSAEWRGWNLPNWLEAAKELEQEGVRAIVGGCGLTGNIQSLLAAEVDLPVYSSSVLFVPMVHKGMAKEKRVGIMTVSSEQLLAHNKVLFNECGVTDDIPIAIAGMNEASVDDREAWLSMTTFDYDKARVEQAVVNVALKLQQDYADLGAILLECTEMPVYADAIRKATGLPVFDAVDMVKWVHKLVD